MFARALRPRPVQLLLGVLCLAACGGMEPGTDTLVLDFRGTPINGMPWRAGLDPAPRLASTGSDANKGPYLPHGPQQFVASCGSCSGLLTAAAAETHAASPVLGRLLAAAGEPRAAVLRRITDGARPLLSLGIAELAGLSSAPSYELLLERPLAGLPGSYHIGYLLPSAQADAPSAEAVYELELARQLSGKAGAVSWSPVVQPDARRQEAKTAQIDLGRYKRLAFRQPASQPALGCASSSDAVAGSSGTNPLDAEALAQLGCLDQLADADRDYYFFQPDAGMTVGISAPHCADWAAQPTPEGEYDADASAFYWETGTELAAALKAELESAGAAESVLIRVELELEDLAGLYELTTQGAGELALVEREAVELARARQKTQTESARQASSPRAEQPAPPAPPAAHCAPAPPAAPSEPAVPDSPAPPQAQSATT